VDILVDAPLLIIKVSESYEKRWQVFQNLVDLVNRGE
jgi:hypothetical protein